ncbi:MAG: DUF2182 domain-containing protein [Croceibacterium sp.]
MPDPVVAALRRQRSIAIAALALLTLLAWGWLLLGAGMGPGIHAELTPYPWRSAVGAMPPDMPMDMAMDMSVAWSAGQFLLAFSMWWVMMVAMMIPAAAPVILLFARAVPRTDGPPPTGPFLAGYVVVWGLFSVFAAGLQGLLNATGLLGPMTMGFSGKWISAAVIAAAGLYQLSPLKEACLTHCRNPAVFLTRHYRGGRAGAFRLGVIHGAFCTGCCWLLMALLFVGGVMNLAWIALLTLLVAAEKLLPSGRRMAIAAGLGFIVWGLATAFA